MKEIRLTEKAHKVREYFDDYPKNDIGDGAVGRLPEAIREIASDKAILGVFAHDLLDLLDFIETVYVPQELRRSGK